MKLVRVLEREVCVYLYMYLYITNVSLILYIYVTVNLKSRNMSNKYLNYVKEHRLFKWMLYSEDRWTDLDKVKEMRISDNYCGLRFFFFFLLESHLCAGKSPSPVMLLLVWRASLPLRNMWSSLPIQLQILVLWHNQACALLIFPCTVDLVLSSAPFIWDPLPCPPTFIPSNLHT